MTVQTLVADGDILDVEALTPDPTALTLQRGKRATVIAYRSGFCGPSTGECRDKGKRCPGVLKNGASAARPLAVCVCTCHP